MGSGISLSIQMMNNDPKKIRVETSPKFRDKVISPEIQSSNESTPTITKILKLEKRKRGENIGEQILKIILTIHRAEKKTQIPDSL